MPYTEFFLIFACIYILYMYMLLTVANLFVLSTHFDVNQLAGTCILCMGNTTSSHAIIPCVLSACCAYLIEMYGK